MMYTEDEMLMLSGIQHFAYCPRQWALIHIEQSWTENRYTTEGRLLHKNADDPFYRQKNGKYISLRSVAISSKTLGLYGYTDVLELHPSDSVENSIMHPSYPGFWSPFPVEYKRGHSKPDERDAVQLAAQVICLEEMYGVEINRGYLFYGETRHREEVIVDDSLRRATGHYAEQMHMVFRSGNVPIAQKTRKCDNCSLLDVCLPVKQKRTLVSNYLKKNLYA